MTSARRTRLVVLFGGRSVEHAISCVTALYALRAIDRSQYNVEVVGITRQGRWIDATAEADQPGEAGALPSPDDMHGAEVNPWEVVRPAGRPPEDTVVFPLLHGPMGEDGTVQGLLELAGAAYVGAGVLGAAASMHKAACKEILASSGLPQARWLSAPGSAIDETFRRRIGRELGFPCFVKPASMGSSIGITRVTAAGSLSDALDLARRYDDDVIVEESLSGREIAVGVLGNAEPRASLPGEIVPGTDRDFHDYEDKYVETTATMAIPAPLDAEATEVVRALALDGFKALHMEGMARVDFFYVEEQRRFYLNEVNAIPGFRSLFTGMWEASGLSRTALIDELIRLAVERHHRRLRWLAESVESESRLPPPRQ